MASKLGTAVLELLTDSKGLNKGIKDAHSQTKKLDKQFGITAKQAKIAGAAILGVVAAATGLAALSIKAAIEFEDSFTGVRKTVDATEKQFKQLEKGLKDLSKQIPVNINELNGIAEAAGQLGIKRENIVKFTRVMADLGVATNLTGIEAATMLAKFDNVTTGGAQQTFEQLGATIVFLGNNLATTEREVVEMATRLAGAGAQIKLTQADILSLAGSLSSVGLEAEAGGTAFSRVMVEMQNAVLDGGDSLKIFNQVIQGDFRKAFKEDAAQAINSFIAGLARMSEEGKNINPILDDLGLGAIRVSDSLKRTGNAVEKLSGNLDGGRKAFKEMNALTEEAAKRYATTSNQMKLLKGRIELVAITVGNSLLPEVNKLVAELIKWVDENEELITQDVKGFIDGIKDVLPALITLAKATADAIGFIATGIAGVVKAAKDAKSFIDKTNAQNSHLRGAGQPGPGLQLPPTQEELLERTRKRAGELEQLKMLEQANEALGQSVLNGLVPAQKALDEAMQNTFFTMEEGNEVLEKTEDAAGDAKGAVDDLSGGDGGGSGDGLKGLSGAASEAEKALEAFEKRQESFTESLADQIESLEDEILLFGKTSDAVIKYEAAKLRAKVVEEGFNEELLIQINRLETLGLQLDRLERIDALKEKFSQFFPFEKSKDDFEEFGEVAEKELTAIDVFAADIASNINSSFADALESLVFNIDGLKDAWKSALRSMANAFFQLLSTIVTNPIRIALEGSLSGGGAGGAAGGAGGIGSILGGAGGLGGIGSSFGALGGLFGIGGASGAASANAVLGGLGGGSLVGTGGVGFLGTLGAALPAIGAIVAAIAIAIPLIASLFKKKPKIDVDIGVLKEKVDGEIEKRGANVQEFLDALDDTNGELAKQLVRFSTVQGGVGVKGKVREDIRKAILTVIGGTIESVQTIINQLPKDLADRLNESLLSAEVNIENVFGKDKLLEFDEKGKKVAEKLQDFISGTLPAHFLASLSEDFFVPMFESLGVIPEAAQSMMDDFISSLEGVSPEQAAALTEDFLSNLDAYVDVFNLLDGGIKGIFEQAITDIQSLSSSLEIESASGIPSLGEIQAGLENLFEAGKLTAETAQQFLALRQAVIDLNLGLSRSISNTTSTIAQLDSDIVGLDGSAIGTTAGIEAAISQLQGLLDSEGLSLDERESILNELNSLTDQLAASELEKAQQGIQLQTESVNSQIQNLQRLKTVEAEKNQAALDALNAELSIVEALESLLEAIRRNISSLLLAPGGPESVFERIGRARSNIADLFAELATASPEDRAGIASEIQELLNQLDSLRQEAFQAPSAESDDLFREIIGGLEQLEGMVEPARSAEEIQASIEDIERASQAYLSSIDSQISSFQSKLTTLQSSGNQLTGEVADRVRELKESIRDDFVQILEARIEQLGEVAGTGLQDIVAVEEAELIELREHSNSLNAIAGFTQAMASIGAGATGGGGGFNPADFVPGFARGSNGFMNFGKGTLAMLHGVERVQTKEQAAASTPNVYLTLPPLTFAPNQVVNPQMFVKELFKNLHNPIVTRELEKIIGTKR